MRILTAVWILLTSGIELCADSPADFFGVQAGHLPIVITAPHGGNLAPSDVAARSCDNPGDTCANDLNTNLLAAELGAQLEVLTGLSPYYVINKIDRDYIDLNRDNSANPNGTNAAYDDGDARPYYDYYHHTIRSYIEGVLSTWGEGIVLDIHGQSQDVATIFRGTQNGLTVQQLVGSDGEAALIGPDSIFGQLESRGYDVTPPNLPLSEAPETTLAGGFTVRTYGSHQPGGIDALQLEFGRNYRSTTANSKVWMTTAADLAAATHAFWTAFLVEPTTPGDYNDNRVVDAADYTVWRDTLGEVGAGLPADGDQSTIVDQADFGVWKANFGVMAAGNNSRSSTSVPEPAGAFLLMFGSAVVIAGQRFQLRSLKCTLATSCM